MRTAVAIALTALLALLPAAARPNPPGGDEAESSVAAGEAWEPFDPETMGAQALFGVGFAAIPGAAGAGLVAYGLEKDSYGAFSGGTTLLLLGMGAMMYGAKFGGDWMGGDGTDMGVIMGAWGCSVLLVGGALGAELTREGSGLPVLLYGTAPAALTGSILGYHISASF